MGPERREAEELTLPQIRAELDELAERRLYHHPTREDLSRWEELTTLEEAMLARRREVVESPADRRDGRVSDG
jgi:hypothetical protein